MLLVIKTEQQLSSRSRLIRRVKIKDNSLPNLRCSLLFVTQIVDILGACFGLIVKA